MRRLALLPLLLLAACDGGLAPPEAPPVGAIRGIVVYAGAPEAWPPPEAVQDLRFVALPFVPRDTTDLFRDLARLVASEGLAYGVLQDTFEVQNVPAQTYLYSGVAQKYGPGLFDWRPVGLYAAGDGTFRVRPGETVELRITVDFTNPPVFPPASAP